MGWACEACTLLNADSATLCQVCEAARPTKSSAPPVAAVATAATRSAESVERARRRAAAAAQADSRHVAAMSRGIGDPAKAISKCQASKAQTLGGTFRAVAENASESCQAPEAALSQPLASSATDPPPVPPPADTAPSASCASAEVEASAPVDDQSPSMALALQLARQEEGGEDLRFGRAVAGQELQELGIYFEAQPPLSDTCAQHALNNLVQKSMFSNEDLGQAEIQHGQSDWSESLLSDSRGSAPAPTGFFDIEAIKRAAVKQGIQVVDVEPKANFRESELPAFLAGCGNDAETGGGESKSPTSWFKGFLVYDSRPSHARHFYAIVARPGRRFVVLNSLTEDFGAQNRFITEDELWQMHEHYALDFRSWVFRWYPVVCVQASVLALQHVLRADDQDWHIGDERAEAVIQSCRWQVPAAAAQLLQDDVQHVLQRFRAGRLVIPRSTAQAALEAAGGDAKEAAEKLAGVLQAQAAAEVPEDTAARRALNAAGWKVDDAVSVLELAGCGGLPSDSFETSRDILQRVAWHFDNALKVRKVLADGAAKADAEDGESGVSAEGAATQKLDVETAASLLEACSWNAEEVARVVVVQQGYPQCPLHFIRRVLQRNDGDISAAVEMLKDFRERVCAHVIKCSQSSKIPIEVDEIDTITEAALDWGNWGPAAVLDHARRLVNFVLPTKDDSREVCLKEFQEYWMGKTPSDETHGGKRLTSANELPEGKRLKSISANQVTIDPCLRPFMPQVLMATGCMPVRVGGTSSPGQGCLG